MNGNKDQIQIVRITKVDIGLFEKVLDAGYVPAVLAGADTYALGAVYGNEAAGALVFRMTGFTAQPLWLAVSDAHRRKGVASALMSELCREAWLSDSAVVGDILVTGEPEDDDMLSFLKSLSFISTMRTDQGIIEMSREEFAGSYLAKISNIDPGKVGRFCALKETEQKRWLKVMNTSRDVIGDGSMASKELSLYIEKDGRPVAAAFVENEGEDTVCLDYLWSDDDEPSAVLALLAIIYRRITEQLTQIKKIRFAALTEASVKLADRLFPDRNYTGYRYLFSYDMDNPPCAMSVEAGRT